MSDPIHDLAEQYDIHHEDALHILHQAIGEVLGYSIDSDVVIDGRITFLGHRKNGSTKRINLSPLLENRVRSVLEKKIDAVRIDRFKRSGANIIQGVILKSGRKGLVVTTAYGKAFAPKHLLIRSEEEFYKTGTTLDFHVNKITPRGILLDRRSKSLVIHILRKLLPPGFVVYDVRRKFGKLIRVYSRKLPEKPDLERIRSAFVEHIDFVMYDGVQIEDLKFENEKE